MKRKRQAIDLGDGVEVVIHYSPERRPQIKWEGSTLLVVSGEQTDISAFAAVTGTPEPVHRPQSSLAPITPEQAEFLKARGYQEALQKKRSRNPSAELFDQELGDGSIFDSILASQKGDA
jgi:hypothetical protein